MNLKCRYQNIVFAKKFRNSIVIRRRRKKKKRTYVYTLYEVLVFITIIIILKLLIKFIAQLVKFFMVE